MECLNCGSKRFTADLTIFIEDAIETKFEYDNETIAIGFECKNCKYCWSRFYIPREDTNYADTH